MPKGYWVVTYRAVRDQQQLAAYAALSGPAVAAFGGRFLVRGPAAHAYELGAQQRTVVIEFDTLAAAVAAHDSPAYREALAVLADAAERDFRIVEGAGG
ncbi:MAG: DUF1330 domain-containing protein [Frankiaceae bacterium]|jgi:uncharacterized protein (DUF1330 family)|nr:DUF1330 domain-containing protein [Frankiaceae bacterium]